MNIRNKICLITGGAGFIGSNLANKLSEKNKVIIVDNLSNGNLQNLKKNDNLKFFNLDVRNIKRISNKLKKVDYVFHLAALTSVEQSLSQPRKYYENNVDTTQELIQFIKHFKIKKVLYAASASCYGKNKKLLNENSFIDCISPYAKTKWVSEQLLMRSLKNFKIPFISLRLFNVYGPNCDLKSQYAGVIGKFISKFLKNKSIEIYGNGNQTRSFIHVNDIVKAFILAGLSKKKFEIYNVGASKSITINKLASFFPLQVNYKKKREGEVDKSSTSIKKIKRDLNFNPEINLEDGIKNYIGNYEKK